MGSTIDDLKENKLKIEEDVFEITDFTNSSDWEKFIAGIEEIIVDWNLNAYVKFEVLHENELATNEWETKCANLRYIYFHI